MNWFEVLAVIIGPLLILMACGVPVALAFLMADAIGAYIFMGGISGVGQIVSNSKDAVTVFTLLPIPLFILMGELFYHSGLGIKIFTVLDVIFANVRGRLSYVTVVGGTIFATLSGSSLANTAMLGSMLIPEMTKRGYKKYMAIGPILATGALAMIIPPSSLAVLLGSVARINIGQLLVAGVVPGLILAFLYILIIYARIKINPQAVPPNDAYRRTPLPQIIKLVVTNLLPMGIVILAVVGTIFWGVATPTEASAFGVISVLILCIGYRMLSREVLFKSLMKTAEVSGMIFLIIVGSAGLSQVLAFSGATQGLLHWVIGLGLGDFGTLGLMVVVVLLLGMIMDQVSIILVTMPIFMPIVGHFDYNQVWFGIIMLLGLQVGLVSPPFGMELFVMQGVAPKGTSMLEIVKSGMPYLVCALFVILAIMVFPIIVTAIL